MEPTSDSVRECVYRSQFPSWAILKHFLTWFWYFFWRFYVDKIPIRVFKNNTGIGVNYPSQAMSVVGSLWSDTTWAAHGQQINWTQAPFVAYFQGFNINGCLKDIDSTSQCNSTHYRWNGPRYMGLDQTEIVTYEKVRRKYLTYSYCSDRGSLHPECPRRTLEWFCHQNCCLPILYWRMHNNYLLMITVLVYLY